MGQYQVSEETSERSSEHPFGPCLEFVFDQMSVSSKRMFPVQLRHSGYRCICIEYLCVSAMDDSKYVVPKQRI